MVHCELDFCFSAIYLSILFAARILVATGEPGRQGKKSEIIDLINPKIECDYMAGIALRSGTCGGLLHGQPIVCGGYNEGKSVLPIFFENISFFVNFTNF